MNRNVGGELKGLATVILVGGILISLFLGLVIGNIGSPLIALMVIVVGSLISWVFTVGLHAFGQLVENSDTLVRLMTVSKGEILPSGPSEVLKQWNGPGPVPLQTLTEWREKGLITEDEWQEQVKKWKK
jgi:hypothetical protein